jgi:hypothetical protein
MYVNGFNEPRQAVMSSMSSRLVNSTGGGVQSEVAQAYNELNTEFRQVKIHPGVNVLNLFIQASYNKHL